MSAVATGSVKDQARLFSPLTQRGVTFRNRVVVSPMCMYSSEDGFANDWHFVHLGSRAVGGAGAIIVEATGVEARGRITPGDMGIWKDEHVAGLSKIVKFMEKYGAVPGIQLAHAGRKASCHVPWQGSGSLKAHEGAWETVGPSAIPFAPEFATPRALDESEIPKIVDLFVAAAGRAVEAGFRLIEIHAAHGYLLHEFLSPLSNQRTDRYGGSLENRARFVVEVAKAVRKRIGEDLTLWVRVSATDWTPGGFDVDEASKVAAMLKAVGVDLIDCSSGANVAAAKIPIGPGYQVPLARQIRAEAGIATGAVGMITEAKQADDIITSGSADVVLLARAMLKDPYWAIHAAKELGHPFPPPVQYGRGF